MPNNDRPMRPMTNEEILVHLCNYGSPVNQLFIMDAIGKVADRVIERGLEGIREDFGERPMIHPDAWYKAAQDVRTALDEDRMVPMSEDEY